MLTTDAGLALPGEHWTSAAAGPALFKAVGLRMVAGRGFDALGPAAPTNVVVINESLATFLFRGQDPIGRRLRLHARGPMETVIGVVSDAKQTSPRDRGLGVVYYPLRDLTHVVVAVRTTASADAVKNAVARELDSVPEALRIGPLRTMTDMLNQAIAQERVMSDVSILLGVLVVAVGWFGLYGLAAYEVSRRTRELGVRLALGATGGSLSGMVLRDSLSLVAPALAFGIPLGVALGRLLSTQLYEVRADDPGTLAAVACLVAGVGLLAAARPARLASRLDPMVLLRHD
jgi:ABC-type antimicrobial peptide transport system permease subunit